MDWVKKGSRQIYQNHWMEVVEDQVIRPDGKPGIFGIVKINPWVAVLPVGEDGEIYVVEQYRYTVNKITIETVAGGVEKGEDFWQAGKRELAEEAGIIAKKWDDLGQIDLATSVVNCPGHILVARDLSFGDKKPEATENIKVIKTEMKTALEWIGQGKITSAVSALLILTASQKGIV